MPTSQEKNMIIGALATGGVDAGMEAYYSYQEGSGHSVANQFPFIGIHPALPPVDDLISNAGVPLLLYALGKTMKKPRIVEMAKGGAIYGVSELIGLTMYRLARFIQQPALATYVVTRR